MKVCKDLIRTSNFVKSSIIGTYHLISKNLVDEFGRHSLAGSIGTLSIYIITTILKNVKKLYWAFQKPNELKNKPGPYVKLAGLWEPKLMGQQDPSDPTLGLHQPSPKRNPSPRRLCCSWWDLLRGTWALNGLTKRFRLLGQAVGPKPFKGLKRPTCGLVDRQTTPIKWGIATQWFFQ